VRDIAAFFEIGEAGILDEVLRRERERYDAAVSRLRPRLEGKTIFITTINTNLDWLLTAIEDLGMEVVKIGVMNYLRTEIRVSERPDRYPIDGGFPFDRMDEEIRKADPDIVLSNYTPKTEAGRRVIDALPMLPRIGFDSGLAVAERWVGLMTHTIEGSWRKDRKLYENLSTGTVLSGRFCDNRDGSV